MYPNPNSIDFGALAAERDVSGLHSYFLESESFRRFRDGRKTVALGNRGAGKTAIFTMVAAHERALGNFVVELSPDQFSYEILTQSMVKEVEGSWAKHGAYASAWKFLLYVAAMKAAVQEKGLRVGAGARIYSYLRDHHSDFSLNPIATLISFLKRLEKLKVGNYEAALKARELHRLYRLEEIEPLLNDLNETCAKHKVVILVDELDRGWDASEDAKAFVAGLFQAATSINIRTKNVRVLISLRQELYENIPSLYEDAQKVRDIIEVLEWDESQLRELVAKRIGHSYPESAKIPSGERWNLVFANSQEYGKPGSFKYMADRTLLRPRELITFCIEARDRAISEGRNLPIEYDLVRTAEKKFSADRVRDVAAENRFQYPKLESIFETFRGRSCDISRDELEDHCISVISGESRVDPGAK
jgi:hypothetical protein